MTIPWTPEMRSRLCLFGLFLLSLAGFAQEKPGEAVNLDRVEIKGDAFPGGKVVAVIQARVAKGYHVHSNRPSDPRYIGTRLTLEATAGAKVGNVAYPKGKLEKVAGLDQPLSVYEGSFEISVPLGLGAAAKLPLTIPATLTFQACRGAVCYKPQKLTFAIVLPARP